jgi:hypothetical protein|tara:strand:- start:11724 stop:12359 length:636 start_codon:yes stop_codon:yes gene_type:complete
MSTLPKMSEIIVVTGILVKYPYAAARKWATFSALLSFAFFSLLFLDTSVENKPEFGLFVLCYSILPFICFYIGTKKHVQQLLKFYCVIQYMSAVSNVFQLALLGINNQKIDNICSHCTFVDDKCLFVDSDSKEWFISQEDCNDMQQYSMVYGIMYVIMIFVNIRTAAAVQSASTNIVNSEEVSIEAIDIIQSASTTHFDEASMEVIDIATH